MPITPSSNSCPTRNHRTSVWLKLGLIVLLVATGAEVRAAPARCQVVAVADGATLTVRCGAGEKDIRLAGVDGPAHQALFWARARRNLSALLLQKDVLVDVVSGAGSDGEERAQVYLGSTHVNASVVDEGMARCHGSAANDWCARIESGARSKLRGVWSDPWLSIHSSEKPLATKRRIAT